jgi:hypothetical protein
MLCGPGHTFFKFKHEDDFKIKNKSDSAISWTSYLDDKTISSPPQSLETIFLWSNRKDICSQLTNF